MRGTHTESRPNKARMNYAEIIIILYLPMKSLNVLSLEHSAIEMGISYSYGKFVCA